MVLALFRTESDQRINCPIRTNTQRFCLARAVHYQPAPHHPGTRQEPSQKGGVGKSAVARLIAREYAASGWSVRVADFDTKQMTTTEWAARRLEAGLEPVVEVQNYTSVDKALRGAEAADMLVMDGRGFADK